MPSRFASKLASLAENEYNQLGHLHETTTTMVARIRKYWDDIGLSFPGVSTPWSAVFVSFHVKAAGASAEEFKFSSQHSQFVFKAAKNAAQETGVFRARRIDVYAPKIGDIIQNNRDGNSFDFQHAASDNDYKSHSAIVVEEGQDGSGRYVRTVGGNEGNKVGDSIVRLRSSGLIRQPSSDPSYYICVIETLK